MKHKINSIYRKYYGENEMLRRFTKVLSLDILVKASMVFLIPFYYKVMPENSISLDNYLFNFISGLSLILNFGLYAAHTKLYYDLEKEDRKKLNFTVLIYLLVPLFIILLFLVFTQTDVVLAKFIVGKNQIDIENNRVGLILAVFITVLSFMLNNFLISTRRIKELSYYNLARLLIVHPITLITLYYSDSYDKVEIRLMSHYLLESALLIYFSKYFFKEIEFKFIHYKKKITIIAFPIFLNAIAGLITNFSSQYFLIGNNNMNSMAGYGLLIQISSIILIISLSFFNSAFPDFLQDKDKIENFKHTIRTTLRVSFLLSLFAVVIVLGFVVANYLNVFSHNYNNLVYVLAILLISKIIDSSAMLYARYTVMFEVTYWTIVFSLVLSPFNIIFNNYFIPQYLELGAAISSLLFSVFQLILTFSLAYYYCMVKK